MNRNRTADNIASEMRLIIRRIEDLPSKPEYFEALTHAREAMTLLLEGSVAKAIKHPELSLRDE